MKNDDQFVADFIQQCIENQVVDTQGICEQALKEIEELDIQIHAADMARVRKNKLTQVLKYFNHKSARTRNTKVSAAKNKSIDEVAESITDDYKNNIIDYISTHPDCNAMDILQFLGDFKNNEKVFFALKILVDEGKIQKDSSNQYSII